MSFSLTESDIVKYRPESVYGQYFVWNYSQTDTTYNEFLIDEYKNNHPTLNLIPITDQCC